MVKIYVDGREKQSRIPNYLVELGASIIYKELEVGDYIPADGYIIERKRVDDLVHSVFQGRFFDQIRRLTASGSKAILLIEGNYLNLKKFTDRYKAVEAALITAVIYNDLRLLITRDARHSAEVIKYVSEKLQSRGEATRPRLPTYRKLRKPKEQDLRKWQVYVLSSFPGIGPSLAIKLLKKFGSLGNVFNASPTELSRVEGITEEKARVIHKILDYGGKATSKGLDTFMRK